MGSFQELLNRTRGIVPNSTITNTKAKVACVLDSGSDQSLAT